MATPVAHKGATQARKGGGDDGPRSPDASRGRDAAKDYFATVQQAPPKSKPLLRPEDKPAMWLNKETRDRFKPELRKYCYDPSRYKSYLEQVGVQYPPPMPTK